MQIIRETVTTSYIFHVLKYTVILTTELDYICVEYSWKNHGATFVFLRNKLCRYVSAFATYRSTLLFT